jgi:cellulose synthase/poly-beta-1,6-N-acetylglucosamine synthase-like glycosyltransferase
MIVALLPAHNEAAGIANAVRSLQEQTLPPDSIIVIADNCNDNTAELALEAGALVFETRGNTAKKAGALNQALQELECPADALVLVMDADSALDPEFLSTASARLAKGDVAAVGGTFYGQPGGGLVGFFQRAEYGRYARDVARLKGKVLVLTGTATLFKISTLREVSAARGSALPGEKGRVYDTRVLTEDNELTLAILHLGHSIVSPLGCRLTTEVMPTWKALAQQRLRWKRGAIENLVDYGLTRITLRYWLRQVMSLLGVLVTAAYLASILYAVLFVGHLQLSPFWLAASGVFALERVVTVRSRGWLHMAVAVPLVIEMFYDLFLQAVQARAFLQAALVQERNW